MVGFLFIMLMAGYEVAFNLWTTWPWYGTLIASLVGTTVTLAFGMVVIAWDGEDDW